MPRQVALSTKLAYGIGDSPITMTMVVFSLFIMFFYNSVMGLPATLVGIASSLGLCWDAVIDPYIGYRSDRSRHPLGRRHAYMLGGALTLGIAFCALMSPPRGLSTAALFGWLLGTTILFRMTSAIFRIPYLSLGAELSDDYHERTTIVGFRSFFGLVAMLVAASLSFRLFFPNRTPGVDPKMDYAGYPQMGIVFGIVMTVTALVAYFGTSRHRHDHGSATETSPAESPGGFLTSFGAAFGNRYFRRIWLSFSLLFLGVVLLGVVSIHYFTWYVEIDQSAVIGKIQLCFYLGAIVGVLLWVMVSRRVEKHRAYCAAVVITAGFLFAATFLFGEGHLFGTGNPVPLYVGNCLVGLVVSAVWVLPGSMLADVADHDELNTRSRREGILFGLLNFGEKIAAGAALLIGGVLIDHFVGLVPGETEQMPQVARRIGMVYGLVPGLMLLGSLAFMRGYDLDSGRLREIRAELSRRRRASAATKAAFAENPAAPASPADVGGSNAG